MALRSTSAQRTLDSIAARCMDPVPSLVARWGVHIGRLSLVIVLSSIPALARAAEGDEPESGRRLFGRVVSDPEPATADEVRQRQTAFEDHMQREGWVRHGDIVAPAWYFDDEPDPGTARAAAWEHPPHRATIFLNFFGGKMTNGTNAAEMQSNCIQGTVDYAAYGGTESTALAIIQMFESKMAPYGVRIAYETAPPKHLPYQMVMMGGRPQDIGLGGGALGVSCSSDCGDRWWRDTTFAFTEVGGSTTVLARTALQEAAHAFGLGHIDGSQHIMYPYAQAGDPIWATSCVVYNDATGGINCKPTHDIWCGGGAQNDDAELLAYFGPNTPDTEPPVATILSPEDGAEIAAKTSLPISVMVTDDHEGVGWRLVVLDEGGTELASEPAYTFQTEWSLEFPQGIYKIRVEAVDHDRNEGSDEVTVYVGVPAPEDTTGGMTEGGTGDPDTEGETSGTSGGDSGNLGDDDKACACTSSPTMPAASMFLLALGVGLTRRSRS